VRLSLVCAALLFSASATNAQDAGPLQAAPTPSTESPTITADADRVAKEIEKVLQEPANTKPERAERSCAFGPKNKREQTAIEKSLNASVKAAAGFLEGIIFVGIGGADGGRVLVLPTVDSSGQLCGYEKKSITGTFDNSLKNSVNITRVDHDLKKPLKVMPEFVLMPAVIGDGRTMSLKLHLTRRGEAVGDAVVPLTRDENGTFGLHAGSVRPHILKLMAPVPKGSPSIPLVVLVLIFGAMIFTFATKFINLRGIKHAVSVIRGKYDDPDAPGEVTHSQAFSSALSATVGLGNISGVAVAVHKGGPGAVFWMVFLAFFGMAAKFVESTLSQRYRHIDADGHVEGGAFMYLSRGLAEMGKGMGFLGKGLAIVFALFCIGGSFGGGNMFQSNQAFVAVSGRLPFLADKAWLFGLVLAVLVGLVIIGNIQRIGAVAEKIVPTMVVVYMIGGITVLLMHLSDITSAVGVILSSAFTGDAVSGGIIGVLIIGFTRAAFSNEAGIGSSAIAHAAAKSHEPVREGLVAMMEPFLDTIIVCAMTGLVVVITGAYTSDLNGVLLTEHAFASVISWFPWVLAFAVCLFAFSTMISWSYYGERSWEYIFGRDLKAPGAETPLLKDGSILIYKLIFVGFVFVGAIGDLGTVIGFSDLMILAMAFPNIIGCVILLPKVRAMLADYWQRYTAGEMPPTQ
jgi:alanine or glycine:cation symporter, AGCS family